MQCSNCAKNSLIRLAKATKLRPIPQIRYFDQLPTRLQVWSLIFLVSEASWFFWISCQTPVTSSGIRCKDWAGKKVTILYSTLLMVKSSEIIWFFNLHFTWLCGSWNHKKNFEKYQFWKYDSCFSSCKLKLSSVWNKLNLLLK